MCCIDLHTYGIYIFFVKKRFICRESVLLFTINQL